MRTRSSTRSRVDIAGSAALQRREPPWHSTWRRKVERQASPGARWRQIRLPVHRRSFGDPYSLQNTTGRPRRRLVLDNRYPHLFDLCSSHPGRTPCILSTLTVRSGKPHRCLMQPSGFRSRDQVSRAGEPYSGRNLYRHSLVALSSPLNYPRCNSSGIGSEPVIGGIALKAWHENSWSSRSLKPLN